MVVFKELVFKNKYGLIVLLWYDYIIAVVDILFDEIMAFSGIGKMIFELVYKSITIR